jgi:DNA-binding MarR family transcriptional regulator
MRSGQTMHYWTMNEERIIQESYRKGKYYGMIAHLAAKLNLPTNKVSSHIKDMRKRGRI